MKHRSIIFPLLAGAVVLAALLGITRSLIAAPPAPLTDPQLSALQAELAAAIEPEGQALLADKIDVLQGMDALRATGAAIAPTKPANPCALRPLEGKGGASPSGVRNGPEMVLPDRDLAVLNAWQGELDGQRVSALAAVRLEDRSQAVIVVSSQDSAWGGEIPAPEGSGELRFTSGQDGLLILENPAGQTYRFDLAALQFTGQQDSKSLQVVPVPTYTPVPSPCE